MSEGHVKLIKHADRRVSGMGIVSTEKKSLIRPNSQETLAYTCSPFKLT